MYSSVFSWRSAAGSAFNVDGPATAKLHGRHAQQNADGVDEGC